MDAIDPVTNPKEYICQHYGVALNVLDCCLRVREAGKDMDPHLRQVRKQPLENAQPEIHKMAGILCGGSRGA